MNARVMAVANTVHYTVSATHDMKKLTDVNARRAITTKMMRVYQTVPPAKD